MRHASILEQVDFRRMFEPDANFVIDEAHAAEAVTEQRTAKSQLERETAAAYGAPLSILEAGLDAWQAFNRVSRDPLGVHRSVAARANLAVMHLLDERPTAMAEEMVDLERQSATTFEAFQAAGLAILDELKEMRDFAGARAQMAELGAQICEAWRERAARFEVLRANIWQDMQEDDDGDDSDDPAAEPVTIAGLTDGPTTRSVAESAQAMAVGGAQRLTEGASMAGAGTDNTEFVARNVTLIRAGFSSNVDGAGRPRFYPAETLKAAAGLFEGTRAFRNHPSKSQERDLPERDARDILGYFQNVKVGGHGELKGDLHVVGEARDWLWPMIVETARKPDLVALSINAMGVSKIGEAQGTPAVVVEALTAVNSVDVVTSGAAGGSFAGATLEGMVTR